MPTSVAIAIGANFAATAIAEALVTNALIAALPAWVTYAGIESAMNFTSPAGLRLEASSCAGAI